LPAFENGGQGAACQNRAFEGRSREFVNGAFDAFSPAG
jgi:hypothetical protein